MDFQIKVELDNEIQCNECGEAFQEWQELKTHRENAHKSYLCKCCKKEDFSSLADFEYHLQAHGGLKLFKCVICEENFQFLSQLNDHLPSHLPEEKHLPCHEEVIEEPQKDAEIKEEYDASYEDDICGNDICVEEKPPVEETKNKLPLPINDDLYNLYKRKRGKKPWSEKSKLKYAALERNFKCPLCPFSTKTASNLKIHNMTHTKEKPFQCAECGKSYAGKSSIRIHVVMKHNKSKEKTEICPLCGKAFYFPFHVRIHIRDTHNDREKRPCHICGKLYTASVLSTHMQKHTNQSYPCSKCDKCYDTRMGMMVHFRNKHVAKKKFKCTFESCKFQTNAKQTIEHHQRTHTGEKLFTCEICNKSLSCQKSYKLHKIHMHSTASLQCEFCEKLFKEKRSLQLHCSRVHNERTLPCPVCNKMYGSNGDVSRHLKDSHPAEWKIKKAARTSQKS
ncbi:zinc finger protein 354A-like isoform X1 [Sergentomyia squamirostris]